MNRYIQIRPGYEDFLLMPSEMTRSFLLTIQSNSRYCVRRSDQIELVNR
jgi:hypothetical protein